MFQYLNTNITEDSLSSVVHLRACLCLSLVIKSPLLALKQNSVSPHNTKPYLSCRIFVYKVEKSKEKIEESSAYIIFFNYKYISIYDILQYIWIYIYIYIYHVYSLWQQVMSA